MPWDNLQIVGDCDNFPYPDETQKYNRLVDSYYTFNLLREWTADCVEHQKCGYLLPSVVSNMPWTEKFLVNHEERFVSIKFSPGADVETNALRELLETTRAKNVFKVLQGWRDELYAVFGVNRDVRMERAGSALFGILTVGVHLNGFVHTSRDGLKLWIPRRSKTKATYPSMLDNTVAGGIAAGEDQLECMIREAGEEASLPEEFTRESVRSCGAVSYFHIRDHRAGGETELLQPETQYVYDLEIPETMVPKPSDNEVEGFYLWTVERTKAELAEGNFKPNCAVVLIDFLIRHGLITAANEPHYREIISRIHRRIRF